MTTNTCTNPLQAARSSIQSSKKKNRRKLTLNHEEEHKSETKRLKSNTATLGFSQENNNKNQNDKKYVKARELWLRKIGAGYQLFIEYYSYQPIGTVCVHVGGEDSYPKALFSPNEEKNKGISRQGLSRASLKRRRKVQKVDATLDNNKIKLNNADSCLQEEMSATKHSTVDRIDEDNHENNQSSKGMISQQQIHELNHNANFLKKVYNDLSVETKISKYSCCRSLQPFITALSHDLPITFRIRKTAKISVVGGEMMASTDTLKDIVSRAFSPINVNVHQNEDTIYQSIHNISKKNLKLQYPDVNDALIKYSQNGILCCQYSQSSLFFYS